MPSNINARLAALETVSKQIIKDGYTRYWAREREIIGEPAYKQFTDLLIQYRNGQISDAEYEQQVKPLFAPYDDQIERDPEMRAIWRPLSRAEHLHDLVNRYIHRCLPLGAEAQEL